jgi:beta-lactamase class A
MAIPMRARRALAVGVAAVAVGSVVIAGVTWLKKTSADPPPSVPVSTSLAPSTHSSAPVTSVPVTSHSTPTASVKAAQTTPVSTNSATKRVVTPESLGLANSVNVAVVDLTDGDSIVAGTAKFETASIVKVDILAALLWRNDGKLTPSQRILAREMITESDNDAANDLFTQVGGRAGLTEANATFGLTQTTVDASGEWGLTQTTVSDQIALLRVVFTSNDHLSTASRTYMQGLMRDVEDDQTWGVSSIADDEDDAYVKNGWLPRSPTNAWDINSIGAAEADGHTYLVAALSSGATSMDAGVTRLETAIRKAVTAIDS